MNEYRERTKSNPFFTEVFIIIHNIWLEKYNIDDPNNKQNNKMVPRSNFFLNGQL